MDFLGALVEGVSSAWQADKQADMADHAMDFSADQASKNRDFQERMRATQYQTAVGDMKAAGLNPMLAYSQGGAGTPGGSSASGSMGSVQKPNIMDAMSTAANIKVLEAQARKTNAEADITEDMKGADNPDNVPKTYVARLEKFKGTDTWYHAQDLMRRAELTDSQRKYVEQQIVNAVTENKIAELSIPKLINEAKAQESDYMKHFAPYTGELGKITSSAASLGHVGIGAGRLGQGLRMNRYIIHGK